MRRFSYLELCAVACVPGNDVPGVDTYLYMLSIYALSVGIYNIYLLSLHNICIKAPPGGLDPGRVYEVLVQVVHPLHHALLRGAGEGDVVPGLRWPGHGARVIYLVACIYLEMRHHVAQTHAPRVRTHRHALHTITVHMQCTG